MCRQSGIGDGPVSPNILLVHRTCQHTSPEGGAGPPEANLALGGKLRFPC